MLSQFPIYVNVPAADVRRARRWYEQRLGLRPVMELGPGLLYASGGVPFLLYVTEAAGTARNTAASWIVEDLDSVMTDLRSRGVVFEEYAMGDAGPTTVDGVAQGRNGVLAAWFKDSEGNVLSLHQLPAGMELSRLAMSSLALVD